MTARQTPRERQVHREDEGETARHGEGVMQYWSDGDGQRDSISLLRYSITARRSVAGYSVRQKSWKRSRPFLIISMLVA